MLPARNSLPRSLSLKRRVEITDLLRTGQRFAGNFLTLSVRPADTFGWCVLVGRRHGSATRRNQIKRLVREAVRLERFRLDKPLKIAVLPLPTVRDWDFHAVRADVCSLFEKVAGRA